MSEDILLKLRLIIFLPELQSNPQHLRPETSKTGSRFQNKANFQTSFGPPADYRPVDRETSPFDSPPLSCSTVSTTKLALARVYTSTRTQVQSG